MEINILCLVNKSSQTTEAVGGIVTFFKEEVLWIRLLSKLYIDKFRVINDIKVTRILTLNRQLCANK